ncbi:MAG: alpha/beta hydrolase fold domain-containing protein [Lentisphaeria bacterium]|nr:alpha/beta hydrolase fold domain-containing protein [Lentisphaeria bacterium]
MVGNRRIRTATWLAILGFAVVCQAQRAERFMKQHDRDGDGKLSREEFPARAKRLFNRIDTNKDGFVTLEEDSAFRRSRNQLGKQGNRNRGKRPPLPAPSFANVPYGTHERNVLDFWKADSDVPTPVLVFFHGGGFRAGDKGSVNALLLKWCMESGISFAASNYRLSSQAPYPAQMHDSARAIQFLRSKAKEWNIDASRFAAYGGSAGAGLSLWLAFHDDLADPASDDPVARQSTRLACAIGLQAQCTYDPRVIKKIVPGRAYQDGALKLLYGLPPEWDWDTADVDEALDAQLQDASPIAHLTRDDPPTFVYHRKRQDVPGNIHHANFGRHLKKAMDALDIESIHRMDTNYDGPQSQWKDVFEFVKKQFRTH